MSNRWCVRGVWRHILCSILLMFHFVLKTYFLWKFIFSNCEWIFMSNLDLRSDFSSPEVKGWALELHEVNPRDQYPLIFWARRSSRIVDSHRIFLHPHLDFPSTAMIIWRLVAGFKYKIFLYGDRKGVREEPWTELYSTEYGRFPFEIFATQHRRRCFPGFWVLRAWKHSISIC